MSGSTATIGTMSRERADLMDKQALRREVEKVFAADAESLRRVADALWTVRRHKLFEPTHSSFGEYCGEQLPHRTRRRCDQLAAFGALRQECRDLGTTVPRSERPVRALAGVEDSEQRRAVIEVLVGSRGGLAGVREAEVADALVSAGMRVPVEPPEVEMVKIDDLTLHEARRHYESAQADSLDLPTRKIAADIAALAESILDNGFLQPIVVANDGTVLMGNRVVIATRRIGWDQVPAVCLDVGPTDPKARDLVNGKTDAQWQVMKDHRDPPGTQSLTLTFDSFEDRDRCLEEMGVAPDPPRVVTVDWPPETQEKSHLPFVLKLCDRA